MFEKIFVYALKIKLQGMQARRGFQRTFFNPGHYILSGFLTWEVPQGGWLGGIQWLGKNVKKPLHRAQDVDT